jgi:hypothetical protein
MPASEVLAASASDASSGPAAVGGRRRRGGAEVAVVAGRRGGAEVAVVAGDVPAMGGRHMTRKQRASVKKVARALKAANKKAFRLAMTLKKKLRR